MMAARPPSWLAWLLFLCTLLSIPARAASIDTVKHMALWVDPEGSSGIEQALAASYAPLPSLVLNPGYTRAAYWLRIRPPGGDWLVEAQSSLLDRVELHYHDENGVYRVLAVGDSRPFSTWLVNHRHPVFPVSANVTGPVYLRIQSDGPMSMPLRMWRPDEFRNHLNLDEFGHGLFYGVMAIMVAYNLFLYFAVRDRNYLNYVLFIGAFVLFQAAMNGYGMQYLWPDSPWLANHAQTFLVGVVVYTAMRFALEFLDIANTQPIFLRPMRVVEWAGLAMIAFSLLGPYWLAARAANYLGLVLVLVVLPAGMAGVVARYRPAYWFVSAWGLFLLGVFVTGLALAGHIPYQAFTANAMQVGAALEVMLLSLALADRIATLRAEKEAAQDEANQHLRLLNENLEDKVRRRTRELTQANQALEEKNRILADIAKHDSLTRLLNHAEFMALLKTHVGEARRYGYPIALMMIDIDHFKNVNDQYGHQLGDQALVAVAQALDSGKRASDEAARYGGEEFALLLPHADMDAAKRLAERLRLRIADIRLDDHPNLILTASFGVAAIPVSDSETTPAQLLQRADQALYQAKREGRNRVRTAS
jgi:diguanylate cyclase (GGDEF)-like protein